MVVLQHVVAPDGVAAGRGYSQVVTGRGRLVVVSGQVAQNERGELVGPGDPAAQARQVFENLRRCLAQAGAGFGDVVKLAFFVLEVADLPALRAARDAVIDTARPPASTAVQVAALVAPGYLLEVEAWALVGELPTGRQRLASDNSGAGRAGSRTPWRPGHIPARPDSATRLGTRSDRTTVVSSMTPTAMMIAICLNCSSGITASSPKLAASAIPAVVIAPEARGAATATASRAGSDRAASQIRPTTNTL